MRRFSFTMIMKGDISVLLLLLLELLYPAALAQAGNKKNQQQQQHHQRDDDAATWTDDNDRSSWTNLDQFTYSEERSYWPNNVYPPSEWLQVGCLDTDVCVRIVV